MAATTTQTEHVKDLSGATILSETKEDLTDDITPTAGVRSWRKVKVEGKTTLVEEKFDDVGGTVTTVETSMTQEPLETHPKFAGANAVELARYRIYINNPSDSSLNGWNPVLGSTNGTTDTKIDKLWSYRTIGITDYLAPRVTVKQTSILTAPPSLAGLGQIVTPPDLPSGFGSTNFLYVGATGQQEGTHWRNTYEYLGSGPTGWETYIYSN